MQNLELSTRTLQGTSHSESKRWPILGAIFGPIFFAFAYTMLGFLRPGFSPVSEPISGLGVGPNAPAMNVSFILTGLLMFVGVVRIFQNIGEIGGAARWICMLLLLLSPIGCIICGLYTYEAFMFHFLGFFLACGTPVICFPAAGLILRRVPHFRRLGNWMIVGGPLTLVLIVLFMATFDYQNTDVGMAGLFERILVLEVHAFYVVLGWHVFRRRKNIPVAGSHL